jgi:uncharacterized repeat protein (TIGR03843 family)
VRTGSGALPADDLARLSDTEIETILTRGSLELEGRLLTASNSSFYGVVTLDGVSIDCIYKPIKGERPLWDFPDGTLAGRERAARVISQAGGWNLIPPTVLREGRFGLGACQRWIDIDEEVDMVDVVGLDFAADGWLAIIQAEDNHGRPVVLVHRDDERLRDMAVLDVIINNADRKGGHVLVEGNGDLWGCDHGVSLHAENKLRTVLWGWADEPLRAEDLERLAQLEAALACGVKDELSFLLTTEEIEALEDRVALLRRRRVMPNPDTSWRAIPWPAF